MARRGEPARRAGARLRRPDPLAPRLRRPARSLPPRLRRLHSHLRRLRRALRGLRRPRATLWRWLRFEPDGRAAGTVAVALGRHRLGLTTQPPGRVVLGAGVRLGDHVDVHLGPDGRVEVGDDVTLGAHVQIAADRLVRIGTGSRIGDYSVLTDTWVYGQPARGPVPSPAPEPVVLGEGVRLGVRSVVGPGVELAPGTRVPPGSLLHETEREAG